MQSATARICSIVRRVALCLLLALAACRSPALPEATIARTDAIVAGSAQQVISLIRSGALAHGWRIAGEGPDSVVVDFGASKASVSIPGASGPGDGRAELRDTEVHCTALYIVRAAPNGTSVTVLDNPIYWHPGERIWLPGPRGAAPGRELLREFESLSAR